MLLAQFSTLRAWLCLHMRDNQLTCVSVTCTDVFLTADDETPELRLGGGSLFVVRVDDHSNEWTATFGKPTLQARYKLVSL